MAKTTRESGLISADELAKHFGVVASRVRQLVKEGMPRAARGFYSERACSAWYIRHLRRAVERRAEPGQAGTDPLRKEKAEILAIDREMKLLDLAERREELVAVEDVSRIWEDAIARMKLAFRAALALGAARVFGSETQAETNMILQEIGDAALLELSKIEVSEDAPESVDEPLLNGNASG